MALTNTINFLPEIFRSETNRRFLGATLDQLVTDSVNMPVNGYIGRTFAPTYKLGDNYVPEVTKDRSSYQLEPSVVVKNSTGDILLNSGYLDVLQSVKNNSGLNNNHQRLFESEYYNYDGHFDYDKFVNYSKYYWVPGGPDFVNVTAGSTSYLDNFTVTRNLSVNGYTFSGIGGNPNTQITLARGGTYTFNINQPGYKFWIQSKPGVSGVDPDVATVNTRNVFGVNNNGTDNGVITFNVPLAGAQDFYSTMPIAASVSAAVTIPYKDIQGVPLSKFLTQYPDGIDGITNQLQSKTFIFVGDQLNPDDWTSVGMFDYDPLDQVALDTSSFLPGVVPQQQRQSVWKIDLIPLPSGESAIRLLPLTTINPLEKVFVESGKTYASTQFWVNNNYRYQAVPLLTSTADYLYYQDSANPDFVGTIKLVDNVASPIDVTNDILGQIGYTSPNGVIFTNGLKIQFDSLVEPAEYINNTYYVEGVGTGIELVPVNQLIIPESFSADLQTKADYITINRASRDRNGWSRSNYWFHEDVLKVTANYNKTTINYGPNIAGRRAIIEFEPNLQLFNFGKQAKHFVDVIVGINPGDPQTDAFVDIQGQATYVLDGVTLEQDMRVIFANDFDINVKNKIWTVDIQIIDNSNYIRLLSAYDNPVQSGESVLPRLGANSAKTYWFDGTNWHTSQEKTALNQSPLFDLVDKNGYSFGDTTVYPSSTFSGSKLFGYATGTGTSDPILEFPLVYQNFNNIGDIVFSNWFDTDSFTYLDNNKSAVVSCNSGYVKRNDTFTTSTELTNWTTGINDTTQYQVITKFHEGYTVEVAGVDYAFVQIDILPESSTTIPHLKVFVNNQLLNPNTDYQIVNYSAYYLVTLNTLPNVGDKIDVAIFSNNASSAGFYEIPTNLNFNPLNENFAEYGSIKSAITLGQLRTHYNKLIENTTVSPTTQIPLRDRYIKAQGGTLLQHSSPAIYSMAFLTDQVVNFTNSLTLARQEYQRFKNKFLTLCNSLKTLDYNNPVTGVDTILSNINSVKNSSFSWYYSDMVPQGSEYNTITYSVLNARQKQYKITSIFNNTELSNRAVLVYLNGSQLTLGTDYTFSLTSPAVLISSTLAVGDTITIREYSNTDGNYIPETPSKLGLYLKFEPEIYLDTTYQTPTTMIRGHDGSLTPAFGDFRDQFLLELEKRIYNNIKVDYQTNHIDLYNTIPGRFRKTDYSLAEWNQLLTKNFLQWVGANNVDYTTNQWYDANNSWTWNYESFKDVVDGSYLQGAWRAIYDYWYDTDAPNLTPWKMIGFNTAPTWWEDRYGPAPYTEGNTTLWEDMQAGYIWNNGNPYYSTQFARPGLTNFIPVDSGGNLKDPTQVGLIKQFNTADAGNNFQVGQHSPVETAWRHSSDYPFAIQQALALARPAQYFSTQADISRFYRNPITNQFTNILNQRITPTLLKVNGDTSSVPGTTIRSSGYLNWIGDYVKSLGMDPVAKFDDYFSNLSVQLAYKLGGFTDQNLITVTAEQTSPGSTNSSIIIPDENYEVYLGKPVPLYSISYSAVIVTRTGNGFAVSGYDTSNPFFTILPSTINNQFHPITVNNLTVKAYESGAKTALNVPYGTTYSTVQQVADFLISYQRYLTAQGFVFNYFDTDLSATRNWELSVNEFLFWVQQGWADGTIIVLNPVADQLNVAVKNAVVDEITNQPNGSRILDANFSPIKSNAFTLLRSDNPSAKIKNRFRLSAIDGRSTIAYAKLNLIQFENTLIFDNVSNFGDIIYVPSQGTRQYRLKLSGAKTGAWDGALSPAGYIYSNPQISTWQSGTDYKQGDIVTYNNGYYISPANIPASQNFNVGDWNRISVNDIQTGLLPSFGHNAQVFENIYDIDNPPQDENYQIFSAGLIGFRERPFLSNLGLSIPTQTKFYQGYVKQKGTTNAINALTNSTFDTISSSVSTYEEWAFQVGIYGDLNNNQYSEFVLNQSDFLTNPVALTLTDNTFSTANIIVNLAINTFPYTGNLTSNIYNASNLSTVTTSLYNNRLSAEYPNDLPSPGYVHLDDINFQIFDISTITTMPTVKDGDKIWVAKDITGNWNVYRINSTNIKAINLRYTLDNFAQLTFNNAHDLATGNFFVLQGFDSRFDGLYRVVSVPNDLNVVITLSTPIELIKLSSRLEGLGDVFSLTTLVTDNINNISEMRPLNDWEINDRVWVNNATADNGWGVYTFTRPWLENLPAEITANTITANTTFGSATAISSDEKYVYVGSPSGKTVTVFANVNYEFLPVTTISNANSTFGSAITTAGNVVVIGAPGSGNVTIYYNNNGTHTELQTLHSANASGQFGSNVALSGNGQWLYVTESNADVVKAYWTATVSNLANYTLVSTITVKNSVIATNQDGSRLFIGAPAQNNGEVYVYTRTANAFSNTQTISGAGITALGKFGASLTADNTGTNLFIGAPNAQNNGVANGRVEHWYHNGSTFVLAQEITHPGDQVGSFGSTISISRDASVLAVGSKGSATDERTTFDAKATVIDNDSTKFVDEIYNSGVVYLFEPLYDLSTNGDVNLYNFVYELEAQVLPGDNFGSSVTALGDIILVGANGTNNSAGQAYIFANEMQTPSWSLTRSQQEKVDIASINRTFIYNKTNDIILASIDCYDPAKGKVLSAVDADIDYRLTIDPALYNVGTEIKSTDYYWGPEQVGKIWWDVDAIRYIDYEQGDLIYRLNNWGATFPGSQIIVCEWVESTVPPSQYQANYSDGIPLFADDTHYSTYGSVGPAGTVFVKYYFWVYGKTSVNVDAGKTNSTYSITSAIQNPQAQGIPYATVLRNDTVALYNVNNTLMGQNSVLHIGKKDIDAGLIHTEYQLVQEGNPNSQIPYAINLKLIDSLVGDDIAGNPVPDPALTPAQSYGISIRPRQSMFIDRQLALDNYLELVNAYLSSYPVIERKITTTLNSEEQPPSEIIGGYSITVDRVEELTYIDPNTLTTGDRVLVLNDSTYNTKWAIYEYNSAATDKFEVATRPNGNLYVQSYKTNLYWSTIDWYDSGYDPTVAPDVTVANNLEFGKLTLVPGQHVRISNNGNDQFVIYYVNDDKSTSLVGIQNGTLQISTDPIPPMELRKIAWAVQQDILVDDLANEYNQLFFAMIKYILTEQKNIDWAFKTSFISALQKIRVLEQFPSYISDNQSYYSEYIDEVKPYRTTVREFVVDYIGNDQYSGDATDFDLPPYWDANLAVYRGPNGEQPYDSATLTSGVYAQWSNNYKYSVVDVIIENPGSGYLFPPQITIAGGGGTGANGYATIDGNGGISSIIITDGGSGYTATPQVIINGTNTSAKAYPVLRGVYSGNNTGHNLVRSISTTMKFDRINYTVSNTFVFWDEITTANIGNVLTANTVINFSNILYRLSNSYTITGNVSTDIVDFPLGNVTTISAREFNNANDRITSQFGYINLTTTQTGLEYPGVLVDGNTFQSNVVDFSIQSFYSNTFGISPNEISVDGGEYISTFSSYAPEELVPGYMRDSLNVTVFNNDNSNVALTTETLGYRYFKNMSDSVELSRIANVAVTTLSANLNLTDTTIFVSNAAALANPNPVDNLPGVIFVNGEKITYWRNYSKETITPWTPSTIIPTSSLISYTGNTYVTLGNVFGLNFANISSNVEQVSLNSLAQIRRAVDGTYAPAVHLANSRVVDSSIVQRISESDIVLANIGGANVTYTTTANVSYKLSLSANINANVGDYINQRFANTTVSANLRVLGNVTSSKLVPVIFVSGAITTLANTITVNGTVATGANVVSNTILGTVNSTGNVTIAANTVLAHGNLLTSSNSSLSNSTSIEATWLKEYPSFKATPGVTP